MRLVNMQTVGPSRGQNISVNRYNRYGSTSGNDMRIFHRLIHSRFCPTKTFRPREFGDFSSCHFHPTEKKIFIGTYDGYVKLFDLNGTEEELSYQCHDSHIRNMETSKDGKLLITSTTWSHPTSCLYSVDEYFVLKHSFDRDDYVEFSNESNSWMLGTSSNIATLYCTERLQKIREFQSLSSNNYVMNRATFDPGDTLILNDGVLYDIRSARNVHKFDKLNPNVSGLFTPDGLQIVANTEIWDLRTRHLMHSVKALDQCFIRFHSSNILYGAALHDEEVEGNSTATSFTTFDMYNDYQSIATIDVKKVIFDMHLSKCGTLLALGESSRVKSLDDSPQPQQETCIRIYDIGRLKNTEDEDQMDEDEEENEDDDDNDLSGTSSGFSTSSSISSPSDSNDNDDDNNSWDTISDFSP